MAICTLYGASQHEVVSGEQHVADGGRVDGELEIRDVIAGDLCLDEIVSAPSGVNCLDDPNLARSRECLAPAECELILRRGRALVGIDRGEIDRVAEYHARWTELVSGEILNEITLRERAS